MLTGVSLDIPEAQTLALLGRNGAGKTTLLRIMLGLIPADAGVVQVAGLDPAREAVPLRSQVGYLAEDQMMYGWMTPLELCGFLAPFYAHWDMDWARACLERFAIPCRKKIRELSKGQSVKLGLVAALAHRPRVVILDDLGGFSTTRSFEPLHIYNELLSAERAGRLEFTGHGYPLVYGGQLLLMLGLAGFAYWLAKPLERTRPAGRA